MNRQEIITYHKEHGSVPTYAWPGGYPVFYLDRYNSILCPRCAEIMIASWIKQEESETPDPHGYVIYDYEVPVVSDIHWEGESLWCENCNAEIESAYGVPDQD